MDENEALNRMLEIVCRDEIAMAITYKVAEEPETHKEDRATKEAEKTSPMPIRTSLTQIAVMRAMHQRVQRNYMPEKMC